MIAERQSITNLVVYSLCCFIVSDCVRVLNHWNEGTRTGLNLHPGVSGGPEGTF